ncbi:hypothetical protein AVEN_91371-1 [Araneus ventricosus]|uniref:MATH domain-containing protein n=1 Tax=Araneus ventricosus TaxID=182803 RepID=A0A4Y2LK65_ARAVE|nr:hypothetical protein AVEN_91371-1 [Araneus ventricosus]
MDAEDTRRIESKQVNFEKPHLIKDSVFRPVIPDYNGNRTLYFERTFACNCPETPTSWSFRVTFQRLPLSGVSCLIAIRRTDDRPGLVDVEFRMIIQPSSLTETFLLRFNSKIPAGRADRRIFPEVIPVKAVERLSGRYLHVELFLFVEGCHRER